MDINDIAINDFSKNVRMFQIKRLILQFGLRPALSRCANIASKE